jgi:penicillin-binding protein 1A
VDPRKAARRLVLAGCLLVVFAAVARLGLDRLEGVLRGWIEAGAARHGLTARMGALRIRPWPIAAIEGLRLEKPGVATLSLDSIALSPGLSGLRAVVGRAHLTGPAELSVDMEPTRWELVPGRSVHAALTAPVTGLELTWQQEGNGQRLRGRAQELRASAVLTIRRAGMALVDPGVVSGTVGLGAGDGTTTFEADLHSSGTRVAALANGDSAASPDKPGFGEPADVAIGIEGVWRARTGGLEVSRWRLASDAATLSGRLQLEGLPQDPAVNLSLEVERVDFARLFRASGLEQPLGVARSEGGELAIGALGSVALQASAHGRLADAGSFEVTQSLDFSPPRQPLPALARLRGDFVHVARLRSGGTRSIEVSPRSPDFIALAEVPPLFVRTLLIGEDAAFFGHRGIDLQALPEAILTNWKRGGAVRGASTITQQLAKNLFLSNEKQLGRKIQELCLALLLEATLDKTRILEIYLNVIEWGPDLFGLGPAARHYFGRDPRELTPKQMAFLVALVPGPIKYQRSFADGTPSPGFLRLVENLLAKLRSVDALSEDAYQAALAEPLGVGPAAATDETPQPLPAEPGP